MNLKTTLLNGNIDEMIYMVQPKKFMSEDSKNIVCKFKKSIYGLRKTSRQWYFKFDQEIIPFDFEMNLVNDCICYKFYKRKYIF